MENEVTEYKGGVPSGVVANFPLSWQKSLRAIRSSIPL